MVPVKFLKNGAQGPYRYGSRTRANDSRQESQHHYQLHPFHEVRHVENGNLPYQYGGQVNKNKDKDGDHNTGMAVGL
jgi:hypothetical protein